MAYYRPSMLPANTAEQNGHVTSGIIDDRDSKEKSKEERPLTLFSVDLSQLSPTLQFIVLALGLIVFMCLYGYYQELVIYGWFERKLSMFTTFLHFLGLFSFSQLQRHLSKAKVPPTASTGCIAPSHSTGFIPVFTMGTAQPRVALFYYMLLIFVRTGAQGMSNLSMTQINYPAKVLFKSASPIVTMIIGITWFRKSYPTRDYIVVLLLVFGLYVFITGDATASPQSTKMGIFYVTLSLFGSAAIPMIQEHCMVTYNSSIEDLLYHTFLGSAIASFLASCVTGEFGQGMWFLWQTGSLHAWFIMFAFTVFGFVGTNFSAGLTLQYGALVNGITNTFRKAVTLGLSFLLFPERNTLTTHKIIGSVIFFCGLLVRIFGKESGPGKGKSGLVSSGSSGGGLGAVGKGYADAHEIDVEEGVLRSERSIIVHSVGSSSSGGSGVGGSGGGRPSLSLHTAYFGNNGSTDFGQVLVTDEALPRSGSDRLGPAAPPSSRSTGVGIAGMSSSGNGRTAADYAYFVPEDGESRVDGGGYGGYGGLGAWGGSSGGSSSSGSGGNGSSGIAGGVTRALGGGTSGSGTRSPASAGARSPARPDGQRPPLAQPLQRGLFRDSSEQSLDSAEHQYHQDKVEALAV